MSSSKINMDMSVNCPNCNGQGKVFLEDYRSMPLTKQDLETNPSLPKGYHYVLARAIVKGGKVVIKKISKAIDVVTPAALATLAFLGTFCGLVTALLHKESSLSRRHEYEDAMNQYNNDKAGIILVEYNNIMATRCFVEKDGTFDSSAAKQARVRITNRHDDLEVAEMAKILNYDEATQGKCYRFRYDNDQMPAPIKD